MVRVEKRKTSPKVLLLDSHVKHIYLLKHDDQLAHLKETFYQHPSCDLFIFLFTKKNNNNQNQTWNQTAASSQKRCRVTFRAFCLSPPSSSAMRADLWWRCSSLAGAMGPRPCQHTEKRCTARSPYGHRSP